MMNGIIFCVCSTSAIFSSINSLEVMSKRTQEDAGEERVTAKSRPMMNLVEGKTRSESQIPVSLWTEQQPRTVRPVMGASSSDYSEWKIDEEWSSQEWKSDELMEVRTGRPVDDKCVIDDMDSDTATESDLSPRSRSFLNRANDRLRKMLDRSPDLRHWKHLYS